jgi:CHASE2 domain-containing sensor protein
VTLNGQLLGGRLSFFQSVCVLGYSIFPLVVISYVNIILGRISPLIKVIATMVAYAWSILKLTKKVLLPL